MIARLATFERSPELAADDDRRTRSLRELLRAQPGFRAGYHMQEPNSGRIISLSIWESEDALHAAGDAVAARPQEDQRGITPDSVEIWQVTAF
jgi:heme-degrading monooxygenase HmoA